MTDLNDIRYGGASQQQLKSMEWMILNANFRDNTIVRSTAMTKSRTCFVIDLDGFRWRVIYSKSSKKIESVLRRMRKEPEWPGYYDKSRQIRRGRVKQKGD